MRLLASLFVLQCVYGFIVDIPPPPPPPYSYALDVGCGNGESTFKLQKKLPGTVVIGIDNNKKSIQEAIRRNGLFIHGDAGQPVFPPDFFQYAQIQYSMIDIVNKIEVVHQLYRVMKKDSMIFLADYMDDHPILHHHRFAPFHNPQENLDMMRYYFRESGIIYKNNIMYSVFCKE